MENITPQPRIGIVMPTWVGDACMATPTIRAIRHNFPSAHLLGMMRPVIAELIGARVDAESQRENPVQQDAFDSIIRFEKRRRGGRNLSPDTTTRFGLAAKLRAQRLDAVLLLTNSLWSALVARMSGSRNITGYARDGRAWLLDQSVPVPALDGKPVPVSTVDYYLKLAAAIGCETNDRSMQLTIRPDERALKKQLWQRTGFSERTPTIVINSNSATVSERVWAADRVRELAVRLATNLRCQVLLHCGPGERHSANRTAAEANHALVASMGVLEELPIGLSKAVLDSAAVVVSSDSGPRHIASALNRPVVAMFGPTNVAWTATYNLPETVISANSMHEISVDTVFEAARRRFEIAASRSQAA